jgi:hypothetical protein
VTNWGVTQYQFADPTYDPTTGKLTALGTTGANQPDGFYVPVTDTTPGSPRTSSVWLFNAPSGNPTGLALQAGRHLGRALDDSFQVGDTHPSAVAMVGSGPSAMVYVTNANDDSISIVHPDGAAASTLDLSLNARLAQYGDPRVKLRGTQPNAIAYDPVQQRVYVAEAGINSIAVLDASIPSFPRLLGRIPTGWYPTAVTVSPDGGTLYVINAKGVGEDANNATVAAAGVHPTGVESFTDGNYIFGSAQKIVLSSVTLEEDTVPALNYTVQSGLDTSVVPAGDGRSPRITRVIFILHENKTFDSMLGNLGAHFDAYAATTFNNPSFAANLNNCIDPGATCVRNKPGDGSAFTDAQYTTVSLNTQALAKAFATAVNYYSDSEESDAGHQFAAAGMASDYTEKTLLVKSGRGLLVNKNFEPEDYPASGYIFNNLARNGRSFKDYGAFIRIDGTDTGTSRPVSLNDPLGSGAGLPTLPLTNPVTSAGDVTSATSGLGQSYFLKLPILAILGGKNANGTDRLDRNYPGYNFNISEQRRAKEFIKDFDAMVAAGTVPDLLYVYQPNDHTGSIQASNITPTQTAIQEVADGDVGLGMLVQHIMRSPVYYDPATNTGAAIFITYDDAQSTLDHIHEHRTPLIVVSPFAKPGYVAKRHYSTASIVKTEELILGVPPMNLGDLLATDLRDLFQPTYNGITAADVGFDVQVAARYKPSRLGKQIWSLASRLDLSGPDRDSRRLGALARLSYVADRLDRARAQRLLGTREYRSAEAELLELAQRVADMPARRRDADD